MSDARDPRARHEAIYGRFGPPQFLHWRLLPRLFAGRNPLSEFDVQELRGLGVTHVLDLREEAEWLAPGRHGREAVVAQAESGIERLHLPTADVTAPSAETITAAADWLDERFDASGDVVFAHCRAGVQRTATVLGAWLARRDGVSLDAALARLRQDGYPGEPLAHQHRAAERWLASPAGRRRRDGTGAADPFARRVRGTLLAGALGDALGAGIEFASLGTIRERHGGRGITGFVPAYGRRGAITDDTQMTLFTVEGLIRAWVRGRSRGICSPPSVVHHAYRRWLHTQGDSWQRAAQRLWSEREPVPDGWLVGERWLHEKRAPGNTCLAALRAPGGLGEPAVNDSKGCGGVMRAGPVGLLRDAGTGAESTPAEGVFRLSVEIAALTHGHPSGQIPAGVLAAAIHGIVHGARPLEEALDDAIRIARRWPRSEESVRALDLARSLAAEGEPSAEKVESLGGGWVAEEALAIAVYAALSHPDDLRAALLLAANHSGDSDSTAAICGNLLGAVHGDTALPAEWLAELEGREPITRLADDFALEISGRAPSEGSGVELRRADGAPLLAPTGPDTAFEEWFRRYPGW